MFQMKMEVISSKKEGFGMKTWSKGLREHLVTALKLVQLIMLARSAQMFGLFQKRVFLMKKVVLMQMEI